MRPNLGGGLGIRSAREMRIRVEGDGTLTVTEPGHGPRVVTSAASAVRAVWVPLDESRRLVEVRPLRVLGRAFGWIGHAVIKRKLGMDKDMSLADFLSDSSSGTVVIFEDTGPVLAVSVVRFIPWTGDMAMQRELSGANALVRGLGLVLEARSAADVLEPRAVRAVHVGPSMRGPAWGKVSPLVTILAGALALVRWPLGDERWAESWAPLVGWAALVVIAPVLVSLVRGRLGFLSLVNNPPELDGRTRYDLPHDQDGGARSHLQIGANDVVIVDAGGHEVWLPGPSLGGVATILVGDPDVHFKNADGHLLQILVTEEVVPDKESRERLKEACKSAGITFEAPHFLPLATINLPTRLLHDEADPPGLGISGFNEGILSIFTHELVWICSLIMLPVGIAAAINQPPWGFLVLAGSLAWIGVWVWSRLTYRHWRRKLIRPERQA